MDSQGLPFFQAYVWDIGLPLCKAGPLCQEMRKDWERSSYGQPGHLVHLWTRLPVWCLVDFGSTFSIKPFISGSKPTCPSLVTASGCWGRQQDAIHDGGCSFMHIVQMAVVSFPIVWADFLKQHGLIGDLTEMRLVGCKGHQMPNADGCCAR